MRGYTLLELLVVLLLLSLLTGLIMPRLSNLYQSGVRTFQLEDLLQQISGLGYQAYQQGKSYRWLPAQEVTDSKKAVLPPAFEPPPLTLPDGWQIDTETAIDYYANGVCTGGIVTLQQAQFKQQWQLEPPLCQPKPYDAH